MEINGKQIPADCYWRMGAVRKFTTPESHEKLCKEEACPYREIGGCVQFLTTALQRNFNSVEFDIYEVVSSYYLPGMNRVTWSVTVLPELRRWGQATLQGEGYVIALVMVIGEGRELIESESVLLRMMDAGATIAQEVIEGKYQVKDA